VPRKKDVLRNGKSFWDSTLSWLPLLEAMKAVAGRGGVAIRFQEVSSQTARTSGAIQHLSSEDERMERQCLMEKS
jgi:hypothetical protein